MRYIRYEAPEREYRGADFERVVAYIEKWRVRLSFVPREFITIAQDVISTFQRAPVEGGIDMDYRRTLPTRSILWPCEARADYKAESAALLHELSHCLAERPPDNADEVGSEMLGFEWASQRFLRIGPAWQIFMDDYVLDADYHATWAECSSKHKSKFLHRSLKIAQRVNLLTDDNKPTFHTPRWCV